MDSYDIWKTTPPDSPESKCVCSVCKESLYVDDDYYDLEGEIYCKECALEWLEQFRCQVTEEMVRGEN